MTSATADQTQRAKTVNGAGSDACWVPPDALCLPLARPVTVVVTAGLIGGAALLIDPRSARADISTLLAAEPIRPTISVAASLFPDTIPGYNQELGLTLPTLTRTGPLAEGLGIHRGPTFILPSLVVQPGYDTNVLGVRHGPGSATLRTAPSVSLDASASRIHVGAFVGLDNTQYFQTPTQSRTDIKAALGATAAVGRGQATLAYSHLALHDDPAAIGAIPSSTPTPFNVDDLRASFDLAMGRAALRPFVDLSLWSYGRSQIGAAPVDQSYRDRIVLQAGLAGRFNLGERRDVLATVSVVRNSYSHTLQNQASPSSTDLLALGGLDYELNGNVRFRVLAGLQSRNFDAASFRQRLAPVGQAALFWTPQRQTVVSATLSRSLEDLAQEDTGGTVFTRGEVAVSHELKRNWVLRGRMGVQSAQFLQLHGTQALVYGGTGFEWTINRYTKMLGDLVAQRSSSPIDTGVSGAASGPYTRGIAHLGVTIAI